MPFDAPSDYEIMRMHAEAPMPSITERCARISRAHIDECVQTACAKDRAARFAGTDDFLSALDAAYSEERWGPSSVAPARYKDRSAGASHRDRPGADAVRGGPSAAAGSAARCACGSPN